MRFLVCPVCKSTEIELDSGGYTGKYYCKKCGYVGSFILEMDEGELKEFLEAERTKNSLNKGEKDLNAKKDAKLNYE